MTPDVLSTILTGYWTSQMVSVAAKLGLADLVKEGPRTAEDLAAATKTDAAALYRLLRGLASVGIFREDAERRFATTATAERLQSDVPGSQRSLAIMIGEEHFTCWGHLLYCVQTGRNAFEKIYGEPIFDWLSKHPEQAKTFDEAMVGVHGRETGAMLDAYDFSSIGVLADVGGGNGSVLRAVLERHPKMQGMLCDLPGVVERARPQIAGRRPGRAAAGGAHQLFRVGRQGSRRLPDAAHHPRLDRRAVARRFSRTSAARSAPAGPAAGRGERHPAGQRSQLRQAARLEHARHPRRQGTHGRRISEAVCRCGLSIDVDHAHDQADVSVIEGRPA